MTPPISSLQFKDDNINEIENNADQGKQKKTVKFRVFFHKRQASDDNCCYRCNIKHEFVWKLVHFLTPIRFRIQWYLGKLPHGLLPFLC